MLVAVRPLVGVVCVLLAVGCSQPTVPSATASVVTTAVASATDRAAVWRADLASLVPAMADLHPTLEHGVTRRTLDDAVMGLSAAAATASDDEMLVGLMRVVALVSSKGCDGHTGAYVWGAGTYPVESLPLRLWLFGDGVFIVDALPPYRDLIGWRIDAFNGHSSTEVVAAIDPLVPRDNEQTVRLLMPRYLLIPQVLGGLKLGSVGATMLTLSRDGDRRSASVTPIAMKDYNAWAGGYGLHLPADSAVPYLSRIDDALWWRTFDEGGLFYVQWNRVDRLALGDLRAALLASGAAKVVLDMRHNYGGEVSAVDPMLDLFTDPTIDRPGRLFIITGRNTFSAATMFVARALAQTSAILVGETAAGCPTAYGNSRPVTLMKTGIVVSVSTLLEIGTSANDRRLAMLPSLPAPLTVSAWQAREDPALAAIRAYGR